MSTAPMTPTELAIPTDARPITNISTLPDLAPAAFYFIRCNR